MNLPWIWERIENFGSLREQESFCAWLQDEITKGISKEIDAPADQPHDPGDRWFRHLPTGSLWRLVPLDNPYGPGFWPADEDDIPSDPPPSIDDHRSWPPISVA
jgi:hypothetical protein